MGLEITARKVCARLGLYLLAEGTPAEPQWDVFSTRTGRFLLNYFPARRLWRSGKQGGWNCLLGEALDTARQLNAPEAVDVDRRGG